MAISFCMANVGRYRIELEVGTEKEFKKDGSLNIFVGLPLQAMSRP